MTANSQNKTKQQELDSLIKLDTLEPLSEEEVLHTLCTLIEHSNALSTRTGTHKAIELSNTIDPALKMKDQRYLFHYYLSIAFADLRKDKHTLPEAWQWDHEDLASEIVNLRYAALFFDEAKDDQNRFLQIYTNLGTLFSSIGRFIPAFENWNKVLTTHAKFGTAMAAKGDCMIYHGLNTLFDPGHQHIFLRHGYETLKKAIEYPLEKDAKEGCQKRLTFFEQAYLKQIDSSVKLTPNKYDSPLEKQYRAWALKHSLFLNPLSDIGDLLFTDYDPLLLPTMTIKRERGASFHSMFNELKKQYTTARYFLFEGIYNRQKHLSENDVKIYDLRDLSENSYRIEQLKTAYRLAYSIFDKTASFLNYYMDLGIPERKVNFQTLWYNKSGKDLKPPFINSQNLMLRALFWVSKDLYPQANSPLKDSIEPEARELASIRHHIEHKGFKVRVENPFMEGIEPPDVLKDFISLEIKERDFSVKAIKILKLAKEAITYLSLGVHREEDSNDGDIHSIEFDTKR